MGTSNSSLAVSEIAKTALKGRIRRFLGTTLLSAVATLALTGTVSYAQGYPNRPITIVAPFPGGGATDLILRNLQSKLEASLGQPIVIENRGGGSGNIGTGYVARATPDGYTILLTTNNIMAINPHIFKSLAFDPVKDFVPLANAAASVLAVIINPAMPVNTLPELIAYAKTQSKPIGYGTAGTGSPHHVAGILLAQRASINLQHVPYKGSGPALNDVLGGHIQMGIVSLSTALPHVESGKVKVLAITEKSRFAATPKIPAVAETLPGFEATSWLGFFAPANTPQPIVDRLSGALIAALKAPDVQAKLLAAAHITIASTPAELANTLKTDLQKWGSLLKDVKLQAE